MGLVKWSGPTAVAEFGPNLGARSRVVASAALVTSRRLGWVLRW